MSQVKTKFIENAAVTTAKIATGAVTGNEIASSVALAGSPTTTTQSASDNSTKVATTAYVDAATLAFQSGLSWQSQVKDRLATPPGGETTGDRYLVSVSPAVAEITTFTAVADVSGSLNNTYFEFSSTTVDYYVWYNNGTGTDPALTVPALASKTGIEISYNDDDAEDAIGDGTKTAIDAISGLNATNSGAPEDVTITRDVAGAVTDAADTGSTGFTIATPQQGVDAGVATGAWTGQEDSIAEWNGSSYDFTAPSTSYAVLVDDELDGIYIYGGASWSKKGFEATTGGSGTTLNGNAIDVNTGHSTIEISGVDLAVAAESITDNELATDAVTSVKMAADSVTSVKMAADSVTAAKLNADTAGLGITQAAGGELDVNVDESTLTIATDTVQIKALGISTSLVQDSAITAAKLGADSVTAAKLNADTAGSGLTQAAGGELDVNVDGSTLEVATDTVQLKDGGVTEAKLNSGIDAQTFDATNSPTNYTPSQVGSEGTTKISAHLKGIDEQFGGLTSSTPNKESFTLSGTDITNQYVDLANVALASSFSFLPVGGIEQEEGVDYTISLTGGVGGNTRITFAGDLATAGAAELVATDKVVIKYDYSA